MKTDVFNISDSYAPSFLQPFRPLGEFGRNECGSACGITCSVEVDERLAVEVVVETLAAVLLQLDLFDPDRFLDHLVLSLFTKEAVQQLAVDRDGLPLLSDLVSSLKG